MSTNKTAISWPRRTAIYAIGGALACGIGFGRMTTLPTLKACRDAIEVSSQALGLVSEDFKELDNSIIGAMSTLRANNEKMNQLTEQVSPMIKDCRNG